MNWFYRRLIRQKVLVPVIFFALLAASMLLIPFVNVNYDMVSYLPPDSLTKQAIDKTTELFGYPGTAEVMADNVTLAEAADIKEEIKAVEGVKNVIWLDDLIDIYVPLNQMSKEITEAYYKDSSALFRVEFFEDNYSQLTSEAIEEISSLDYSLIVSGGAENAKTMKEVLSGEIVSIILFVLPVCLLFLFLASYSWFEPVLYLITIGVAIGINMGTNAFFNNISFITNSMASVLQLAICMDYSIFLLHRYFEERDAGLAVSDAIRSASVKSTASISASALTTIAGFIALLAMRYKIGTDVGLVLAKGIAISLVSVMLLLPVLISVFSGVLDRTRHRFFIPSFSGIGRFAHRSRYWLIALFIVIMVPAWLAQNNNSFFYGDSSVTSGQGTAYENKLAVEEKFGASEAMIVLLGDTDIAREAALAKSITASPQVLSVVSLATLADPAIPESFLPESVISNFRSGGYSRMVVYLRASGESDETFEAVSEIRRELEERYPGNWYAAGMATSLYDIRGTVERDSLVVGVLSLLAVGLVVLFVFRSLSIPIVLLLVIQSSVWINMSVPYYSDFKMAFIGYLVISSLQLGATIDYGILLTNRYREYRHEMDPKHAAAAALGAAGPSIAVSALILATAGFGFGLVSQISSISELGILIGRGAAVSCGMTLLMLPAFLAVFDRFILATSLKKRKKAS